MPRRVPTEGKGVRGNRECHKDIERGTCSAKRGGESGECHKDIERGMYSAK